MKTLRRVVLAAVQVALVGLVAWVIVRTVRGQWDKLRETEQSLHPNWLLIVVASIIVVATYMLLVQAWRWNVRSLGTKLEFGEAARMWFIANVGRYIGKWAGLGTIGYLAQRAGHSITATVGGSLAALLLSIVSGVAVAMAAGGRVVEDLLSATGGVLPQWLLLGIPVGGMALIVVAPWVLPMLLTWTAKLLKRPVTHSKRSFRLIWQAAAANFVAWIAYGLAFRIFTEAMFGEASGSLIAYVSVYAAAYIVGLLSFLPGGLGVREAILVIGLQRALGMELPQAVVVAAASRVWLSVLEVLPGTVIFLVGLIRRRPQPRPVAPTP